MMLKRVLCLAVILSSSLFSQELDYMVFGKDIDKTMLINAQKNLYEQMFSDSLISWNKDGLYVFADYNGIKKLFVFEKNNVVRVFSIPVIRQSSLLDPEKYSDEVKKLSTRKLDSRCYTEIELDSNKEHSLMQTQFWKLPYVVPYREYSFLPLINKPAFAGFHRESSTEHLFYIRDFRDGLELKKPLDVYGSFFDFFEKSPFADIMEDCK